MTVETALIYRTEDSRGQLLIEMQDSITTKVANFNWLYCRIYPDNRHAPEQTAIKKNAVKQDNAGAVCNSSMGMLFFMHFILGGCQKDLFLAA